MTEIATILRQKVQRERVVSFARFMECALYCPEIGYYERAADPVGKRGDFFTSVSVGSLFGELLAVQFAGWLEDLGDGPVQLVEAGAHDGRLMFDILAGLQTARPDIFQRCECWIIEPSPRRQSWQRARLEKFAGRVRWWNSLDDLPPSGIHGVLFSNELLDAFPVHVLRWDALEGRWREWGVGLIGGEFAWERMPADNASWQDELRLAGLEIPPALAKYLPDGFTVEVSPAASAWWRTAASLLRRGKLLTIDYGGTAEELLSPQRSQGTLRAYAHHHASEDILANPGEQDLTAHVNFTHLLATGEQAGLSSATLLSQAAFLTRIVEGTLGGAADFGDWTTARTRQFQTLTHPEHLGRSFRVLVQSREV